MTFDDYINYFETAAINNKMLLHNITSTPKRRTFYEVDMDDIWNAMKLDNKFMSMLIECPEIKPFDANSDNVREISTGAFLIIQEVKVGSAVDRRLILGNTLKVAKQILAKIKNDNKKSVQNKNYTPVINGFDFNSVRFQKVGKILTNHFGWRVEFSINQKFENNLFLDENDWNDETLFSIL